VVHAADGNPRQPHEEGEEDVGKEVKGGEHDLGADVMIFNFFHKKICEKIGNVVSKSYFL
jgi:hypothetical protein